MAELVVPLNVLPTFPTDGGKMHTIVLVVKLKEGTAGTTGITGTAQ